MKHTHFSNSRRFGIELEMIGVYDRAELVAELRRAGYRAEVGSSYSSYDAYSWVITSDSSISGGGAAELKSPILRGVTGLEEIRGVVAIVNAFGADVNRSCGFHVHHDIQDFGKDEFAKFLWIAAQTDFIFRRMQPDSRYNGSSSRWCKPFTNVVPMYRIEEFDRRFRNKSVPSATWRQALREMTYDRYVGINLSAYWSKGTVEFRHHSGTLNADKIVAWIVGTQAAVERSYDKKLRYNGDWKDPLVEGTRRLGLRANGYNQPDELMDWAGKELAKRYRKYAGRRRYSHANPQAG